MGVRGIGPSLAEAYAQAALALTAVICDPAAVRPRETVQIELDEADPELLLVDFLNALIFEMATRNMLFSRFEVSVRDGHLRASAGGERIDIARHQPSVEVKGATYTELAVRLTTAAGWRSAWWMYDRVGAASRRRAEHIGLALFFPRLQYMKGDAHGPRSIHSA